MATCSAKSRFIPVLASRQRRSIFGPIDRVKHSIDIYLPPHGGKGDNVPHGRYDSRVMISSLVRVVRIGVVILAGVLCGLAQGAPYYATFTQISTSSLPGAPVWRGWSTMTWVGSPLNRIVMWGGSGGDYMNDIVALDPASGAWATIDPNNYCVGNTAFEPNGSDENGLVWDPSGRLWLYNGGSGYRCGTPQLVGRTASAGTTATSIVDPTLSASVNYRDWQVRAPDGGYAYVTSFNATSRTLTLATPVNVVAGGSYDLFVDFGSGTWAYNFATGTYSKLQQVHWGYAGYVPAPRRSPGFASDGAQAFLFGGLAYDNGLYRLDYATGGYTVAIDQGAASSPPARGEIEGHFVYDSLHDRFVLFGGRCYDPSRCTYGTFLDDTWIYDPSANQWTRATPIVRPPARDQGQMYFDSKLGVVVLYGGVGSTVFNDLWTFDVATLTWTQQAMPVVNPGGVYLGQVAYAPTTQCGYIVYGLNSGGAVAGGTWRLCLNAGNQPPIASFTATPSSATVGSPVAVSAAASSDPDGTIASYAWNFGDGTTASGVSASKSYVTAGTYTVTLTVTDNGGLTGSTTRTVTINPAGDSTTVWVEDAWPAGAVVTGPFTWTTANPAPYSGARAHQSAIGPGLHQHYFYNAAATLSVGAADKLFAYVYLDPANPPRQVMLQFNDGTWEHRAYWGADLIAWGTPGGPSRFYAGPLPPAGQWVRLEVSASQLGLAGRTLNGMAFTLYDGRATWDFAGKTTSQPVVAWVEDDWPAGAVVSGAQDFTWTTANPAPYSGARAHQSAIAAGVHQHYFNNATATLPVGAGDKLFAYVYLDPANPPKQVMLQFNDGTWEHRAYWGSNYIPWGSGGASRFYVGPLPPLGQWVRLEVSAANLGLEGRTLNGMAFTLYDGRATWDRAGKTAPASP